MASSFKRFILVLGLVLGLAFVVQGSRPAQADARAAPASVEARRHFDRGGRLFGLREFEQAIVEYKAGALIEDAPVFDLALGQCYRMLHRYEDALWHFDRFIKYGRPAGKLLEGIEDLVSRMRAELVQQVAARGPDPALPPAPTPTPSSAPPTAGPGERWYRDDLGLAITVAGGVGIGAASYLLLDGHRLYNESNTDPSQMRRDALHAQSISRYELGAVLGVCGVGALITGIVRLATRASTASRHPVSLRVDLARTGLWVLGRF